MKKLLIMIGMLTIMFSMTVLGADTEERVFDNADLLSDSEENILRQDIKERSEILETDIIFVTIDDAEGKSSMEYADDFYDQHSFGYDKEHGSGVLVLLDMDNREVWISTSGGAINEISDGDIDNILDNTMDYVTEKEYYMFFSNSLDEIETSMGNVFTYLQNPLISGIIALAVSGIIILIMSQSGKTSVTVNGRTYMEENSFDLKNKTDLFTHTTTVKHKIETANTGSSTHTSSGGYSHGGGGRSF